MKNVIESKKLQHSIQLLKIELNQRDLLIQNQKIYYEEKCEDLQEKLADMTYQRQLLQTKLDSQIQIERELTQRSQDEVRQQLSHIIERQRQLEDVNQRLISKAHEIRQNLQNKILPTDEEYRILKSTDINSEQMPLKDFIMV
jgi:progesterone-induced-blocking factor 1